MNKGKIISRDFAKDLGSRELIYKFRTFDFVLSREDGFDNYLADCYSGKVEFPDEYESPSQATVPVIKYKQVFDCDLVKFAELAKYHGKGRKQHDVVQDYLMENDEFSVAMELPLVLDGEHTLNGKNWAGFCDVCRILPNKYQLADFKPKAHVEKKAGTQLFRYMYIFSKRTGIPMSMIEGIYFDDANAYKIIF